MHDGGAFAHSHADPPVAAAILLPQSPDEEASALLMPPHVESFLALQRSCTVSFLA